VSPFRWASRVYWEDTDGGGIVYYANYLRFLERARTEWLRSLGYSQRELAKEPGIVFAVVSLSIEYRKPARLDDELVITCVPEMEGAATIVFAQRIYNNMEATPSGLLVEASVRVACLDARSLKPKRLPDFLIPTTAPTGMRSNLEEPS
jgi:acyl-CoA thioester hydrolase